MPLDTYTSSLPFNIIKPPRISGAIVALPNLEVQQTNSVFFLPEKHVNANRKLPMDTCIPLESTRVSLSRCVGVKHESLRNRHLRHLHLEVMHGKLPLQRSTNPCSDEVFPTWKSGPVLYRSSNFGSMTACWLAYCWQTPRLKRNAPILQNNVGEFPLREGILFSVSECLE